MGEKFLELLKESVIVQATITLVVAVTVCYMYIVHGDVPPRLYELLLVLVSFYFGQKAYFTKKRSV